MFPESPLCIIKITTNQQHSQKYVYTDRKFYKSLKEALHISAINQGNCANKFLFKQPNKVEIKMLNYAIHYQHTAIFT